MYLCTTFLFLCLCLCEPLTFQQVDDLHSHLLYIMFLSLCPSGHKVVFLSGTCSGHVGIEHGREIYWLSGSKETWNQESADTVCQQMHCGNAANFSFNSRADMINKVWKNSFSCSSRKKSLFECNQTTPLPPDHHNSTAYVKCSGNVKYEGVKV